MYISHIALWVSDLKNSKRFFEYFFNGTSNKKYINKISNFHSYFIKFEIGPALELMAKPSISTNTSENEQFFGYSHVAFSVGSKDKVVNLTKKIKKAGYKIISEPRETGDGYFESCILDLDNNRIEITI